MGRMTRGLGILVLALTTAIGGFVVAPPAPADAALSPWTGGVNLYRKGVFTTQKTWLWCTAADIQIIRNIVKRTNDHTTKNQRRYFEWMRKRNRYDLPVSAGVDPQGWAAGMRQFVDKRYRLVASRTFDSALRLAVIRLRKTNLPVGITVAHGNHAWILTGFRATADPVKTKDFRVTSVRVTGPLYGKQSKNGYDMKPNTKLSVAQFKRFFTKWKYAPKRMIWDGTYVSIQPVTPRKTSTSTSTTAADTQSTATEPSAGDTAAPISTAVVVGSAVAGVIRLVPLSVRRSRSRPRRRRSFRR